jgi:hypothetical protein
LELLEVQGELEALVGRPVDLVDLDCDAPILAMQVLRHGKLLVNRVPERRLAFAAHTPVRYEDLKIVRREAERALLERVRRDQA